MGSVFPRGNKLWIKYKDAAGVWTPAATGLDVGCEKEARKLLDRIEARIAAGADLDEGALGPVTVERYARHWLLERQQRGVSTAVDDEQRLRLHILPTLGALVKHLPTGNPGHRPTAARQCRADT